MRLRLKAIVLSCYELIYWVVLGCYDVMFDYNGVIYGCKDMSHTIVFVLSNNGQ